MQFLGQCWGQTFVVQHLECLLRGRNVKELAKKMTKMRQDTISVTWTLTEPRWNTVVSMPPTFQVLSPMPWNTLTRERLVKQFRYQRKL